VIRIIQEGVVVYQSENLYDIADWLYHEEEQKIEIVVSKNQEAYDKAQAAKR